MECKYCQSPVKRYGHRTDNGAQRFKCRTCGRTQSVVKRFRTPEQIQSYVFGLLRDGTSIRTTARRAGLELQTVIKLNREMNTLSGPTRAYAVDLIRNGNSTRNIERKTGVHRDTIRNLIKSVRRAKAKRKAKLASRDRSAYHKAYYSNKYGNGMTQYERLKRNDKLRGTIALTLAESARPMTLDELFSVLLPQFPDLKRTALDYMLHNNCEDVFMQVGESHWSYWPTDFHLPIISSKYPERDRARAAWFKKYGLRDPVIDPVVEAMLEKQKRRLIEKRVQVADAVRDQLEHFVSLQAVAMAISTTTLNEHKS